MPNARNAERDGTRTGRDRRACGTSRSRKRLGPRVGERGAARGSDCCESPGKRSFPGSETSGGRRGTERGDLRPEWGARRSGGGGPRGAVRTHVGGGRAGAASRSLLTHPRRAGRARSCPGAARGEGCTESCCAELQAALPLHGGVAACSLCRPTPWGRPEAVRSARLSVRERVCVCVRGVRRSSALSVYRRSAAVVFEDT